MCVVILCLVWARNTIGQVSCFLFFEELFEAFHDEFCFLEFHKAAAELGDVGDPFEVGGVVFSEGEHATTFAAIVRLGAEVSDTEGESFAQGHVGQDFARVEVVADVSKYPRVLDGTASNHEAIATEPETGVGVFGGFDVAVSDERDVADLFDTWEP